jgi:CPA2 family monovalent cation:H+ antiporter-2
MIQRRRLRAEDLAMAVFLPLVAVLLVGHGLRAGAVSVLVALAAVGVVLFVALRFGGVMSRVVAHQSDEVLLLSTFGLVLVVTHFQSRQKVESRGAW